MCEGKELCMGGGEYREENGVAEGNERQNGKERGKGGEVGEKGGS